MEALYSVACRNGAMHYRYMSRLLEMIVLGTPVSVQARSRELRESWKSRVERSAHSYWNKADTPIDREISVNIVYLFRDDILDVDNIVKLILDGITGVAIADDGIISQVLARKAPFISNIVIENWTPVIVNGLKSYGDFVYLTIDEPPNHASLP